MKLTDTLDTVGEVIGPISLPKNESVIVEIADTGALGVVALEKGLGLGSAWKEISKSSAPARFRYVAADDQLVRLRLDGLIERQRIDFAATPDDGSLTLKYDDEPITIDHDDTAEDLEAAFREIEGLDAVRVSGDFDDGFVVTFYGVDEPETLADDSSDLTVSESPVAVTVSTLGVTASLETPDGEVIQTVLKDRYGAPKISLDDQGRIVLGGPVVGQGVQDINSSESVATNGDTATPVSLSTYRTGVSTSGSEGAEELTLGDGTGAIIGQRKLIVLDVRTHASDSAELDDANFSQGSDTISAVELDAEGEFLLAEWRGASWEIIAASSGVVTTE